MNLKALIVIGGIAFAALNSPWLAEGANNNCGALESVALRTVQEKSKGERLGLASALITLSDGRFVARMAREKWPNLPTPISCAYLYWSKSGELRQAMKD